MLLTVHDEDGHEVGRTHSNIEVFDSYTGVVDVYGELQVKKSVTIVSAKA